MNCWDFTVCAPEDSGCSRKWWGLLATQIGLSFLTCPCGKHLLFFISSCANLALCKHLYISTLQVRKCKYLSKALKQFCQSTTYLQRAPNSEKQISPDLSLSKRPNNELVSFVRSKNTYLSCCRRWSCWTRCHFRWPAPFAVLSQLSSQTCLCQLWQNQLIHLQDIQRMLSTYL